MGTIARFLRWLTTGFAESDLSFAPMQWDEMRERMRRVQAAPPAVRPLHKPPAEEE